MKIKAAVCYEANKDLVLEELDLDEPKFGEVLVKVVASGICHTDISGITNAFGLNQYPVVLGHEGGGIIEKVGPGVFGFEPGDHVLLSYPFCGKCDQCINGHEFHCESGIPLQYNGVLSDGTGRLSKDGKPIKSFFGQSSFATHAVTEARHILKIDKSWDLKIVAPLGCGALTGAGTVMNFFKCGPGDSLAVIGAGGVGLSAVMAAKACGCKKIIAIDIRKSRLELASSLGATDVVNSKESPDVTGEIMKITEQKGVDYLLETSGKIEVANQGVDALAIEGQAGLIAPDLGSTNVENFFFKLYRKTIHAIVLGMTTPQLIIPKMLELNKRGMFPFEKLVKQYKFEDIMDAIADSKSGSVIKPVLVMPE